MDSLETKEKGPLYCIMQGTLLNALCGLNGKEIQKEGEICIRRVDSLCCTIETNIIIVKQLHSNKKKRKKEKELQKNYLLVVVLQQFCNYLVLWY